MKNPEALLILVFCILFSCKNSAIDVVIYFQFSEEIDLRNKEFTTFYHDKPEKKINFNLSDDEIAKINEDYESIKSFPIQKELIIEDSCQNLPKPFTIITIDGNKKIFIDVGCNGYPDNTDQDKVFKLKKFIRLVDSIVRAKPGIKDIPPSDVIHY